MATYATSGGILNNSLLQIYQKNIPLKKKLANQLKHDRVMVMSLWPRFLASRPMHEIMRHFGLRSLRSKRAIVHLSFSFSELFKPREWNFASDFAKFCD